MREDVSGMCLENQEAFMEAVTFDLYMEGCGNIHST